jgi:hypothetical protein
VIVHTKQFLRCFPIFEKLFVYLLCCNLCKRIWKKNFYDLIGLVGLHWLLFLRTCFVAGAFSLSVSLCQYQSTQRGAVLWQRKMNWIIFFVLSIVTNSTCLRFIHLYSFFSLIKCGCSGLEVISFHLFYGGCRCEWVFWLQWPARVSFGLQWPLEVITLWRQFVEADDLTAWGFSGLSRFFWAAVASRDSLVCSKQGLFI